MGSFHGAERPEGSRTSSLGFIRAIVYFCPGARDRRFQSAGINVGCCGATPQHLALTNVGTETIACVTRTELIIEQLKKRRPVKHGRLRG